MAAFILPPVCTPICPLAVTHLCRGCHSAWKGRQSFFVMLVEVNRRLISGLRIRIKKETHYLSGGKNFTGVKKGAQTIILNCNKDKTYARRRNKLY